MHTLIRAGFIALAFFCSMAARAQDAIPPALREWQGWVLHGEEFRRCPFAASADAEPGEPIDAAEFRCVWPERLTLAVDARGGTFSQRWQVYAESWVALPGNAEHWPRDVRLNGAPAAVVAVDDVPSVRLTPGSYTRLRPLRVELAPGVADAAATSTAIVDLFVDGSRVAQPERPDGGVWLGKRRSAEQAAAMEVQVYRLVQDEIPTYLLTRIRLNVAGEAREEVLGRALPDGFTPLSLQRRSARAPRARRHACACSCAPAATRSCWSRAAPVWRARWRGPEQRRPSGRSEEIWSFAANDSLRVGDCRRRRRHRSRAGQRARRVAPVPGVSHGRGREAQRGGTQPRSLERRRQSPFAARATCGWTSTIAASPRSTTSRAPCGATGGSTCRRRSRCRARARTTTSCW